MSSTCRRNFCRMTPEVGARGGQSRSLLSSADRCADDDVDEGNRLPSLRKRSVCGGETAALDETHPSLASALSTCQVKAHVRQAIPVYLGRRLPAARRSPQGGPRHGRGWEEGVGSYPLAPSCARFRSWGVGGNGGCWGEEGANQLRTPLERCTPVR